MYSTTLKTLRETLVVRACACNTFLKQLVKLKAHLKAYCAFSVKRILNK